LLYIVETLAQFDDVLVSATALDDRVVQIACQEVNVGGGKSDALDVPARCARLELLTHLVDGEAPPEQRGPLMEQ
jgi:hypothetical protein